MLNSAEKFGGSTVIGQRVPDRRSAIAECFRWQRYSATRGTE